MAIVAVSISPVGAGTSVSAHVAAALRVARSQSRVKVELDSMFTTLEGDLDEIFDLVRRMQEAVFEAGAERVGTVIKIDDRRDRSSSMADKVRAVEARLEGADENKLVIEAEDKAGDQIRIVLFFDHSPVVTFEDKS
jgi:uncharacterized protein (TIGR00106 family)